MTGTFIYGLWGNAELTPRRAKILTEIERWASAKLRPEPFEVYVYGEENRDWLAARDIPSMMLDTDPLVDFYQVGGAPEPSGKGQTVWGDCAIWRHKTGFIQAAIDRHRTVIWLDWDTVMVRPLPEDFWQKMRRGRAIQMSLVQYCRRICGWRRDDKRKIPVGSFVYCRDRRIMERVNREYAKERNAVDQTIFAKVLDQMAGGWLGCDAYQEMGFSPYCHRVYSQIHEPDVEIFSTGGRISHETWTRRNTGGNRAAAKGGA